MLDHDHRVADVAQVAQRVEQPLIVALVQADRRLVQHIQHAGEAGADLRGEADALALAARQRAGIAGQSQIVEADIDQEGKPLADLLQDANGDLVLLVVQFAPGSALNQLYGVADRHAASLADVLAGDLDRQRFRLQAMPPQALHGVET
jgi:hypothetical protein